MLAFDYQAFKAEFRAAAARRGIDAQTGATSFQAANAKAEQDKARKAAAATDWWRDETIWRDPGIPHSETEAEALQSVLQQSRRAQVAEGALTIDDLRAMIRDVLDELATTPLREIHRRRGVQVEWIDMGGARLPVEVPIKVPA